MLKLTCITKDYQVADTKVEALKGVSINFRKSEFVSVLGPSGCGKTTLLNIIGGLDHCTNGDLSILGTSTKKYNDRDWDVYRNHRIGFVFQSYNLIAHQTVLGNVELSLTIAGLPKEERVARAKIALDKVGLSDQYKKMPNQLSGGQCQRVAIARALVNDPEILLADEPTGALDTVTSKQIMDLVKEISKERLVIMVTHNPELAEEYSTRIIKLLDGNLIEDTNPYGDRDEAIESDKINKERASQVSVTTNTKSEKKKEKAKMSFWTAFRLSIQNLFTKKRRTAMTSIAGSIGIIGVSLVLAISFGVQGFITDMQNDMLAGNPITVAETAFDINAIMSMGPSDKTSSLVIKDGYVQVDETMKQLAERAQTMSNITKTNVITRTYVDFLNEIPEDYLAALFLNQGLDVSNSIFTNFVDSHPMHTTGRETSLRAIRSIYSSILGDVPGFEQYGSMINSVAASFQQAPDAEDYLLSQYDVIYSRPGSNGVAKSKNEVMIVLSQDKTLSDLLLAQLGYYSQAEFLNAVYDAANLPPYDSSVLTDRLEQISYADLVDSQTFTWYPNDEIFTRTPTPMDPTKQSSFTLDIHHNTPANGLEMSIVGILQPKEGLNYTILDNGFFYTSEFANYVVQENYDSEIAEFQRDANIGKVPAEVKNSLTSTIMDLDEGFLAPGSPAMRIYSGILFDYDYTFTNDPAIPAVTKQMTDIVGSNSQLAMLAGFASSIMGGGGGSGGSGGTGMTLVDSANFTLSNMGANVDTILVRDAGDLDKLVSWSIPLDGGEAFALPSRVSIYPLNLSVKTHVLDYMNQWNKDVTLTISGKEVLAADREEITYSDTLSLIMNMISMMVDYITIALVAFTSLALVVSCVMIGIITYVSVVERIKEIGVIRSLGGRKRDVSNLFIAETFIIGSVSGIIGITVTYILSLILNLIVGIFGVGTIAALPIWVALIMLGVSILLTLISGLLPSQSAAKKDPVVALRTE